MSITTPEIVALFRDRMIPDGPHSVAMYRWGGGLGVILGALVLYDSIHRGA